ncbi:Hypothetical protein BAN_0003700 (plasmid) [Borrelia anserina BA2]|uniref:Holin, BlyA family protein n=1 Tax=Borrelia anserina BA2 TaxID=1313293 RepID=W5SQ03_BORAN|nr:Hypothetical protein BAN_0003700 [Borrelia anserina BA2]
MEDNMNMIFEFLSSTNEVKLMLIVGLALLTLIPLAPILKPMLNKAVKIIKHLLEKKRKVKNLLKFKE